MKCESITHSQTRSKGIGGRNSKLCGDPGIVEMNDDRPWRFKTHLNQKTDDTSLTVRLKETVSFRQRESGL